MRLNLLLTISLCFSLVNLSWAHTNPAEKQQRQTSFNDHNYTPKPIVNSLPTLQTPKITQPKQRPTTQPAKKVTKTAKWSWETGNKNTSKGKAQWQETGARIDYTSVCANYAKGSLMYRDCRKAMKKTFNKYCKQDNKKAYCHAENNFLP